jgi:N-acetylmuramoyl-L-alanine amidase
MALLHSDPIVPSSAWTTEDLECMAKTIHHEARGESTIGKKAVAHVVLNRIESGKFPD